MYKLIEVTKDTYYVGGSDRRLALFENDYPLNNGVSYNSYLIKDEFTCLLDTVDKSVDEEFYQKLKDGLGDRKLDFLIVNHMEPDHAYSLNNVIAKYPEVTLVINKAAFEMFKNFNNVPPKKVMIVSEGDSISIGNHTLHFVFTPMVHWPEVMMTYDDYSKTLFSADAFGTFGALSGNIFASRDSFKRDFELETRRYYCNIVGKYGPQVLSALEKASSVNIENICPLHGPIWKQDLKYILDLYKKWASYTPEVNGVLVVYGSIYGHSEAAANILCDELASLGVKDIALYDVSKTHKSYLVAEAFRYSHITVVSSTYNMNIFTPMEEFLTDLKLHNLLNRKYAVIANGSWAPVAGDLISKKLVEYKGWQQIGNTVIFKSAVKEDDANKIRELAKLIKESLPENKLTPNPLFNISYGLYVLSSHDGNKQNAMISNSVMQVSENPTRILINVNKNNYSAEVIRKSKKCNVSILSEQATFDLFKRFGFQSGRDNDKFKGFEDFKVAENGVNYLTKKVNAYLSLEVVETLDFTSHYGFVCEIKASEVLSNEKSLTYSFYQENIKEVNKPSEKKKGYVCKVCGYVYEGEEMPDDFICPLCKHGKDAFEKL